MTSFSLDGLSKFLIKQLMGQPKTKTIVKIINHEVKKFRIIPRKRMVNNDFFVKLQIYSLASNITI